MASTVILTEICAICQEEFTSTISDLDLTRPETCETHWFHRECIKEALSYRSVCPLCGKECRTIVDQTGAHETVVNQQSQEADEPPVRRVVNSVEEALEGLSPLLQDIIQGYCAACARVVSFHQFYANAPCNHMFHYHCCSTIWSARGRLCRRCNQRVAAVIRFPQNCIVHFDSSLIYEPQYADLQSRLGVASAPATRSNPCSLCGEIGPGKPRVQPGGCPGSHIVHRECIESRVDISTIFTCPVEGCNRQFLPTSLMDIPAAKDSDDSEERETSSDLSSELQPRERRTSEQSQPSPIILYSFGRCWRCHHPVEANGVHPENCDHLFHRGCLVSVARSNKRCPVRGCKRKFRKIKKVDFPISDVNFLFPVENGSDHAVPECFDQTPRDLAEPYQKLNVFWKLLWILLTIMYIGYKLVRCACNRIISSLRS